MFSSVLLPKLSRVLATPSVRNIGGMASKMVSAEDMESKRVHFDKVNWGTTEAQLTEFENSLPPDDRRRLLEYRAEYETWKYIDDHMPENVPLYFWKQMLNIPERQQRIKFLWYINHRGRLLEKHKQEKEEWREKRREIYEERTKEIEESGHIDYGLFSNNILYKIQRQQMGNWYQWKMATAERIKAPQLVLDLGWLPKLAVIEQRLACYQLREVVADNRRTKEPFRLVFTNVDTSHSSWKYLTTAMLTDFESSHDYLIDYTSKSPLDLFPKENLIQLTPDSKTHMERFDSDKTYIISTVVDKYTRINTHAKAKEEGIATQRLPIEHFIKYLPGARKALCLNHMVGILADVKLTGDWKSALEAHIPQRFFVPEVNDRPVGHRKIKETREKMKMLSDVIVSGRR